MSEDINTALVRGAIC